MKKPVDTPRGYRQLLWSSTGVSALGGTTGVAAMTSAVATPGTIPSRSNQVFFYVESGTNIRFRDDGVAPTAAYGMPVSSGLEYNGDVSLLQIYAPSGVKLSLLFVG